MNIVFFSHPKFMKSQSMPRYVTWLASGMEQRGHTVEVITATPHFVDKAHSGFFKKWLGYIDQYIVFPRQFQKLLPKYSTDTLFVFCDNALGPWVPLVSNRAHIIHCHDFLAQVSALGKVPQNPTSVTGKMYQFFIRRGLKKGRNFISISENTRRELENLIRVTGVSEVVYNGLTSVFEPSENVDALRETLSTETGFQLAGGFILHVGGNQWYKNRQGVVHIYTAWRKLSKLTYPLLMVGQGPDDALKDLAAASEFGGDIHFLTGKDDLFVKRAYRAASVFLFPSIAEGFGWPSAEAMASGTPVITTDVAPMTEVGANAAMYVKQIPTQASGVMKWSTGCALVVEQYFTLNKSEQQAIVLRGLDNVKRFDGNLALDRIENIYQQVLINSISKK